VVKRPTSDQELRGEKRKGRKGKLRPLVRGWGEKPSGGARSRANRGVKRKGPGGRGKPRFLLPKRDRLARTHRKSIGFKRDVGA